MVRLREVLARFVVVRLAVLRGFAAAVERFAVDFFAAAGLLREAAAPLVFARDVVLRFAGLRVAVFAVRTAAAAAAGTSSAAHLPDITRCAASATASAIIEPSLVALDMTLLAAC